jgi:hypothetical protein
VKLPELAPFIALAVVAVWAVSVLASIVTNEYTPATVSTGVMVIVAGAIFGIRRNGAEK